MLIYLNEISKKSKLVIKKTDDVIEFFLENSTYRENEKLRVAVEEMTSIVEDARYVLKMGDVYLPVPNIIGDKREKVERFNRYLGNKAKIIYLRSEEGKMELFNIKLMQLGLIESVTATVYEKAEQEISESMIDVEVMDKYLKNN